jgi:hypothetical protein
MLNDDIGGNVVVVVLDVVVVVPVQDEHPE